MKLNLRNTLFLTITPSIAIVGTALLYFTTGLNPYTLIFSLLYLIATGLAITCGFHRLFAHKSYRASPSVRNIFILLGSAVFEGSVLDWCTDHRNHHRYTDTEKDPYNIQKGFWHAHIGWLFTLQPELRDYSNVKDLMADKVICWQHTYFKRIAFFMGFILPMLICSIWGDPLGGLFIGGALRITLNQHFTFFINSVCHYFGKLSYTDQGSARDHWLTALVTYGEGYHNFHHKFPIDYRNGIRFYDYDPSKWLIRFLAIFGLTQQLTTVSQKRIIQCKLEIDEKRIKETIPCPNIFADKIFPVLSHVRETILQSLTTLEELEQKILQLKAQKIKSMNGKIKEYQQYLRKTKRDLNTSLKKWAEIIQTSTLYRFNH